MKEFNEIEFILKEFYQNHTTYKLKLSNSFIPPSVYNNAEGLGDAIILTSLLPYLKVNNKLLKELNEKYINKENLTDDLDFCITELAQNDWEGGHAIQRFQKSLGLPVEIKPKGIINYDPNLKKKNKVFVHLQNNTDWKRIIPNSLDIKQIKTIYDFFMFNPYFTPYYYDNDLTINELIEIIETCEYFLGIDSGPMHIAAALDLKSIIIINDPNQLVYLPKIKECELPNSEWLYPQNIHLNRSGQTELVPNFNYQNLLDAFEGKVYPYWKEEYLTIQY
jgi:hypothetical protein